MGLIICERHGESGFMPHISKALSDYVLNGIVLDGSKITHIDVVLMDEDDGKHMFSITYWMTQDCFVSLSAKRRYEIESDEDENEFDALFDPVMRGGGLCGNCFEEYLNIVKNVSTIQR